MSLERSYAIAQTLCVCKAAQAAQELRISMLLEKNYILKERSMEMQGVLTRWGQDIEATSVHLSMYNTNNTNNTNNISKFSGLDNQALSFLNETENQEKDALRISELQKNITEVETENIEVRAKLDRALGQVKEVTTLIDIMTTEEDIVKNESNLNQTKWRNKIEKNHFEALTAARTEFAEEKRVLQEQLDTLATAIQSSSSLSPDSSIAAAMTQTRRSGAFSQLVKNLDKTSKSHREKKTAKKGKNVSEIAPKNIISGSTGKSSGDKVRNQGPRSTPPVSDTTSDSEGDEDEEEDDDDDEGKDERDGGEEVDGDDDSDDDSSNNNNDASRNITNSTNNRDNNKNNETPSTSSQSSPESDRSDKQSPPLFQLEMEQMERKITTLVRELEVEKMKGKEAKAEAVELEHLLTVQRESLASRSSANNQPPAPSAALATDITDTPVPTDTTIMSGAGGAGGVNVKEAGGERVSNSLSSSPPAVRTPTTAILSNDDSASRGEARGEVDKALSAVSEVTSELLDVLKSLQNRLGSDSLLRTAMTMVKRVREICKLPVGSRRGSPEGALKTGESNRGSPGEGYEEGKLSLEILISKVKQLENEVAKRGNVPQKQQYLLSDLRDRVVEVERIMSNNLNHRKSLWEAEKVLLKQTVQDSKIQIEDLKQTQEGAVHAVRSRYQIMLDQAQDALEIQTGAARGQIDRLEELLRKAQMQMQIDRLKPRSSGDFTMREGREGRVRELSEGGVEGSVGSERGVGSDRGEKGGRGERGDRGEAYRSNDSFNPTSIFSSNLIETLRATSAAQLEELLSMRRLVHQKDDELEASRTIIHETQASLVEMEKLKSQMDSQREDYIVTVKGLESRVLALQEEIIELNIQLTRPVYEGNDGPRAHQSMDHSNLVDALREAEEQVTLTEMRYDAKCEEVEILISELRSNSSPGYGYEKRRKDLGSDYGSDSGIEPPISQTTARRQRNVRISNVRDEREGRGERDERGGMGGSDERGEREWRGDKGGRDEREERARAVGASLSADTVRNMKVILDEIGAADAGYSDYDYDSERERDGDREGERERDVRGTRREGERRESDIASRNNRPPLPTPHPLPIPPVHLSSTRGNNNNNNNDNNPKTDIDYENSLRIAENEMLSLQKSLQEEKKTNERLQAQLYSAMDIDPDYNTDLQKNAIHQNMDLQNTDLVENTDFFQASNVGQKTYSNFMQETADEIKLPEGEVSKDKVKQLVRKINEMRKQARAHISRLRHVCSISQAKEKDREAEHNRLHAQEKESKDMIHSLKEGNARKAKLLLRMRETKISDNEALDRWMRDAGEAEENVKRLQRSLTSKEALIKDLKTRIEILDEREKLANEIIASDLQKQNAKSKEAWKTDKNDTVNSEKKGKSGIRGSKIPISGMRSGTPVRSPYSTPGLTTPSTSSSHPSSHPSASSSHTTSFSHLSSHPYPPSGSSTGTSGMGGVGGGPGNNLNPNPSVSAFGTSTTTGERDRDGTRVFDREREEAEILSATAHLSAQELRNRLKLSELDRARGTFRLAALKEKVLCLESDLLETSNERDKLLKVGERFEASRAALSRKDAVIKSFRIEVQKLRDAATKQSTEVDEKSADLEKKIRQTQRFVDVCERQKSDSEKEVQGLRDRLALFEMSSSVRSPNASASVSAASISLSDFSMRRNREKSPGRRSVGGEKGEKEEAVLEPKSLGRKPASHTWEREHKSPGRSRMATATATASATASATTTTIANATAAETAATAASIAAAVSIHAQRVTQNPVVSSDFEGESTGLIGSSGTGGLSGAGGFGVGGMSGADVLGVMGVMGGVGGSGDGTSTPNVVRRARLKESQKALEKENSLPSATSGLSGIVNIGINTAVSGRGHLNILKSFESVHIPGIEREEEEEEEEDSIEDSIQYEESNFYQGKYEGKYEGNPYYNTHQQQEEEDLNESQGTLDLSIPESEPRSAPPLPLSPTTESILDLSSASTPYARTPFVGTASTTRGSVSTETLLHSPYVPVRRASQEDRDRERVPLGENIRENIAIRGAIPASLESSILDLADIMQALGAARTSIKREKPTVRRKKNIDTPDSPDSLGSGLGSGHIPESGPRSVPGSGSGSGDLIHSSPLSGKNRLTEPGYLGGWGS